MFDDDTDRCCRITERVFSSHQPADKVPVDCGSMYSLGISAKTYNALKNDLKIEGRGDEGIRYTSSNRCDRLGASMCN